MELGGLFRQTRAIAITVPRVGKHVPPPIAPMRHAIRMNADDNSGQPRHDDQPLNRHLPFSRGNEVAVPSLLSRIQDGALPAAASICSLLARLLMITKGEKETQSTFAYQRPN